MPLIYLLLSLAAAAPSLAAAQEQFIPSIPLECQQIGICEDVPDYPEDHVAAIIENQGMALEKYRVNVDELSEETLRAGSPEDMELCDSSKRRVEPRVAQDKDGIWRYIINQKNMALQAMIVEICHNPESSCSNLAHFYTGYEGKCRQKFIDRKMAALNDKGEMVEKTFPIPSCCSCVVHQNEE